MKNYTSKNFKRQNFFDQNGQILIVVIVILAVMLFLLGVLTSSSLFYNKTKKDLYNITTAFNLAETGINKGLRCLNAGSASCSETDTEPFGANNGKFTTVVATTSSVDGTIESTGTYNDIIRKVKVNITKTLQATNIPFNHTFLAATGTTTIGNNSIISGDVIHTNGNISCGNNVSITGTAVGTISGCSGVTSTTTQTALPDIDIEYWKRQAAFGGIQDTTTLSGTNTIGPKEIRGDLTLANNSTTTIAGAIYVHGSITINNGSAINLDSGFGSATGTVILSRGAISINNNVKLLNSTSGGSLLLVTLTQDPASNSVIINADNNISFNKVILYAPNGTIDIKNNTNVNNTVRLVGKTIVIGNNTATTTFSSTNMLNEFTAEADTNKWRIKDKTWREFW